MAHLTSKECALAFTPDFKIDHMAPGHDVRCSRHPLCKHCAISTCASAHLIQPLRRQPNPFMLVRALPSSRVWPAGQG
eukprot:scaffold242621_cov30-Tisochrysis_lutea.AAC.3